jgi:hypothetical protein
MLPANWYPHIVQVSSGRQSAQPPPPFKKESRRLQLLFHHRLVFPPLAGLAGVRRDGKPNLCVEVSVKVVFFSRLN